MFGIPGECNMHTIRCSIPGLGTSGADGQAKAETLATVHMSGNWSYHAYELSYDGEAGVIHSPDGFYFMDGKKQVKVEAPSLRQHTPREFLWHPNNSVVALWAPLTKEAPEKRIGIMKRQGVSPDSWFKVLYDPFQEHAKDTAFRHLLKGMEWSPKGNAIYVLEILESKNPNGNNASSLGKVTYPGGRYTELFRTEAQIDFFMPPVSRFEHGGGLSKAPYQLIFGKPDGLFTIDPLAKDAEPVQVSRVPAIGLYNVEWNPVKSVRQVLLYFQEPSAGFGGVQYRGVYFVDLDKLAKGEEKEGLEHLYDGTDVHTLWFTRKGKYMTWGSSEEIAYRRPGAPASETVYVDVQDEQGRYLILKGCSWHHNERFLAIAADDRLYVHDAENPDEAPRFVKSFARRRGKDFIGEPQWVGDEIVVSLFEDTSDIAAQQRGTPSIHVDPKGKPGGGKVRGDRGLDEIPEHVKNAGKKNKKNNVESDDK